MLMDDPSGQGATHVRGRRLARKTSVIEHELEAETETPTLW